MQQGAASLPAQAFSAVKNIFGARTQNAKSIAASTPGFENLPKNIALQAGNAAGAVNDVAGKVIEKTGISKGIGALSGLVDRGYTALGSGIRKAIGPDSPEAKRRQEALKTGVLRTLNSPIPRAIIQTAQDPEVRAGVGAVNEVGQAAATVLGAKELSQGLPKAYEGAKEASGFNDVLAKRKTATAARTAKEFDRLAGTIVQGKAADVPAAKSALSSVNLDGVKSYTDLKSALDDKIEHVSNALDNALQTNTNAKPLSKLNLSSNVGSETVSHNYVNDAISQLDDYYTKTNDIPKQAQMKQLRAKAETQGLSVKEMNDLARLHGRDLNGYNANGELASGLTKQAAENTRQGLKATARQEFGNPVYGAADTELSKLIKTRDLVDQVAEQVNKLKQKVSDRGWGEKAGRLVFHVADTLTGGTLKGFVQSFVPRSAGLKIMNALDLERNLQTNLKLFQKLNDASATEADVVKELSALLSGQSP
jgi:hypothetical protein